MPDEQGDHTQNRPFDGARCLEGIRILLVDDSRSVSEAIRIMAVRSGARIRRADTLKAAERHLSIYRPEVVIVDLGLPDGNGVELAAEIVAWPAPRPAVLIISASEEEVTARAANDVGADGYIVKPIASFAEFQRSVLALLPSPLRSNPDGIGNVTAGQIGSDAYLHDLLNAQDLLRDAAADKDAERIEFAAHFLLGVARTIQDGDLLATATHLIAAAGTPAFEAAALDAQATIEGKLAAAWSEAS